jgi:hypothetical protein
MSRRVAVDDQNRRTKGGKVEMNNKTVFAASHIAVFVNRSRRLFGLLAMAVVLVTFTLASPAAWAQGLPIRTCPDGKQSYLCVGDIVVADANAGSDIGLNWKSSSGALILVDPTTGAQTIISQGGLLQETVGVVVEDNGNLVATDRITGVIRVNPANGAQTVLLAADPLANDFFGIVKNANGDFIVTDTGWDPSSPYQDRAGLNRPGRVLLIDKTGKVQSVLAQGPPIAHPFGVALDPVDKSIVLSDMSAFSNQGAIFRLPAGGGNPTVIWGPDGSGPDVVVQTAGVNCPMGITVEDSRNILTTFFNLGDSTYGCAQISNGGGAIFRVNLGTHTQDDFATPNKNDTPQNDETYSWLVWPFGVVTEANRNVLFMDEWYGGIYRVDPQTSYLISCTACTSATWSHGEVLSGGVNNTGFQGSLPNLLVSPVAISLVKVEANANPVP